jgi:DNA replication protein DnaC
MREFERIPYDEHYTPEKTIIDGIEVGKNTPISELVKDERDLKRQLQIKEGDMSFISSGDADFKWIQDYANGVIEVGLDTGNEELDKHFRYKKDFTIINGHSNVGKTTLAMYLMLNASVRHGWKWLVYSSENNTASVRMKLLQFLVKKFLVMLI